MSRLALGTAQFGMKYGIANSSGQVSLHEATTMLEFAKRKKIDTLDTAIAYGESESRLGLIGTFGLRLVSKIPAVPNNCSDIQKWVEVQVVESLKQLKLKQIYGLLLHRPSQLLGGDGVEIHNALRNLKDKGLVQKIGISIHDMSQINELCTKYHFDLVQAPFNLVDRRLHTSGWMDRLKNAEVEIHTRSVFLQGLLLIPRNEMPAIFDRWTWLWRRWHDWLATAPVSSLQSCLAFPLSFPEIDRVIVGVDSIKQLEQIIKEEKSPMHTDFPDLSCDDDDLINPSRWVL